jgi:hypothetical protein
MRRKRNGQPRGTVANSIQDAPNVALDWRKRLQIDGQFRPDIALILKRRMSISATSVRFDDNTMWVDLSDGRTLGVPLA